MTQVRTRPRQRRGEKGNEDLPDTASAFPDKVREELEPETNPFSAGDWRMVGYAWSGLVLRLLLIAGGVFTVLQYVQQRDETRIERALELVELWERPEYQEAQRALGQRIAALNAQYSGLLGADPTAQELRIYDERIGVAALQEDGGTMPLEEFQLHFDRLVYFLNRVAFCVEGNLCKASVVDAYFHDFASSFWSYFAAHVEEVREAGSPNFATSIEGYVAREAER